MDGRFIVFQSNRSGATEIWRANSDGSDLQQLTSGGGNSFPQVTPDSRWVLYTSVRGNKSGIWRVPLTSGEPTRLTAEDSAYPRVSADGKTIACTYKTKTDEPGKLALVPLEGGVPTKLFDLPRSAAFVDGIRWTPNGDALSYLNRGGGVWQQAIAGGAPQLIKGLPDTRIRAYGWSRDGKLMAYSRELDSAISC
jgi:Tol biopolymer transport system component